MHRQMIADRRNGEAALTTAPPPTLRDPPWQSIRLMMKATKTSKIHPKNMNYARFQEK